MKPLNLFGKYLVVTALACAAGVSVTAFGLYFVYRASLAEVVSRSEGTYQQLRVQQLAEHGALTTQILAERLATAGPGGVGGDVPTVLRRAIELDGARLAVLLDQAGQVQHYAGDITLLDRVTAVPTGAMVQGGDTAQIRVPLPGDSQTRGSVGQVFDTTIPAATTVALQDVLGSIFSQYQRDSLLLGSGIAALAMIGAAALIIAFGIRQVRSIRYLSDRVEHLGDHQYENAISLRRRDELGQLASAFERLRERLRTTTISRDFLDKILGSMNEALLVADHEGCVTRANAAATRLLERSEAELEGRPLLGFIAPERREEFHLADSGARSYESAFLNRGGQEVPISYTISEIHDSNPALRGFIVAARNITERKIAEQRIRYLARIDALTKVPNRMQFQHLLQRSIARAGRAGRRLALLYLDVDRFKEINDSHGHTAGDICLEALTDRLARLLPDGTVVGRFAGDEFGIILEALDGRGDPAAWLASSCRSVLQEIAQPVGFHGQQIHMTASIGIAIFPVDARNVIDLIRSADAALYQAKRSGGNMFELYDPEMNAAAADRLMLKSRLRRAYERNELLLHYQPKLDLRTGKVAGAEALVRWDLAERGIVLPSEFIPLAEESNLILDIGEWVLDRVCRDFHSWQGELLFPGKVSVNLSLKQLRQPNFSQRVRQIFRRHGVPPASLELEITETTLMENPDRTVKTLDELYGMGLSLAIDDFGTGYSSLSALQKFPISTLKIDQSFVRDAATDNDDATIVSTIIQMGHSLKLDVIAEGVESEPQLQFLRSSGCDYGQGLLFGKPMAPSDFFRLLLAQRDGNQPYQALFG